MITGWKSWLARGGPRDKRIVRGLGVLAVVASIGIGLPAASVLVPSEARAVIGRPLTPMSYGGMARRTSRRTARRTSARYGAAYGGAAYAAGAYATAPPPGCAMVGGVYQCGGGAAYQPAFDGPNVVYVPVG